MSKIFSRNAEEIEPAILHVCRQTPIVRSKIPQLVGKGHSVNEESATGITALHIACFKSDYGACRILLEYGANVDAQDARYYYTPLHIVTKYTKDSRILELLLDYGPNLQLTDKLSKTCLNIACDKQLICFVRMLLMYDNSIVNEGSYLTPLATACESGNTELCEVLLEHNADPNLGNGYLPIHYAVANVETFKVLLNASNLDLIECFYENHEIYGSFVIHLLIFCDTTKCFDVFLQHPRPRIDLKLLSFSKVFSIQSIFELLQYSEILCKLTYSLRFYMDVTSEDLLHLLNDRVNNEEANFVKFIKAVHFVIKMGVESNTQQIVDIKNKYKRFADNFYNRSRDFHPKKLIAKELSVMLSSVPSLMQLSRKAFRRCVNSHVTEPWDCFQFVNNLTCLPTTVKNYIWCC